MLYKVLNGKVIKVLVQKLGGGRVRLESSDIRNPREAPEEHVLTATEQDTLESLERNGYRRHVFVTIL